MYESHFRFRERPFAAAPQPASYVPAGNIEQAREGLLRCAQRAEGVGLVIGSAGTGKTLLCQLVADQLRYEQFQVVLLASARLQTRRALMQNILFELNLPYRGMEDEELRLSLIDHLTPRGSNAGLVLIIDEAHTLPLRLLEEIRLISNFILDGEPRVRLVLSGGPAMEERLASPKLESLAQRIVARCYLQPLTREETNAYVREQIKRVGGKPDVVAPQPVLRAVFHASDGIPRLINQVCDHALLLASRAGQSQLTERLVEEAWADLQQLPAPWHETEKSGLAAAPTAAIEFGQLGEEPAGDEVAPELPLVADLKAVDPLAPSAAAEVWGEESDPCGELTPAALADLQPRMQTAGDDPFGSGFEEEEVIIDRYASLEAHAVPDRAKVASDEGGILGAALRHHAAAWQRSSAGDAVVDDAATEEADERPSMRLLEPEVDEGRELRPEGTGDAFNPADDPVLPEAAEILPQRFEPLPLDAAGDDDRGMIVVENARQRTRELVIAPAQRRRKYRQLFSALRKG